MCLQTSMAKYYSDRAREYERIYAKPERQRELHQLRDFIEGAFIGLRVLEVACGTGYWTAVVANSASSIVATDISEEVLGIARSKPIDPLKVTFRNEDAYALVTSAERFTGGLAAFWWSHVPKARLHCFLTGFHRRFSPGARIVFVDNAYVAGNSTPISRTDEFGNTYQTRTLDNGSFYEVMKNFPTESELRSTFQSQAADLHIQFLRYYWILSYTLVSSD